MQILGHAGQILGHAGQIVGQNLEPQDANFCGQARYLRHIYSERDVQFLPKSRAGQTGQIIGKILEFLEANSCAQARYLTHLLGKSVSAATAAPRGEFREAGFYAPARYFRHICSELEV